MDIIIINLQIVTFFLNDEHSMIVFHVRVIQLFEVFSYIMFKNSQVIQVYQFLE